MTEAVRALAVFAEPPGPSHRPVADALGLGDPPAEVEYTDVLAFELPPYASIYLGGEGMIGGEARDRIAGFWRALGLSPPSEPDHLAVMLATHAELAEHEEREREPARRAAWTRAKRAFFWEHLMSWLPPYLETMEALAAPFYARWARLLSLVLGQEARDVGDQDRLPRALAAAPPAGTETDLDGLLGGLLAPARSGMILPRERLRRAARDLGLGVRIRDRRLMLRDLVDDDAGAALGWLAAEAGRWAQRHRRLPGGRVAEYWAERAGTTRDALESLAAEAHGGVR